MSTGQHPKQREHEKAITRRFWSEPVGSGWGLHLSREVDAALTAVAESARQHYGEDGSLFGEDEGSPRPNLGYALLVVSTNAGGAAQVIAAVDSNGAGIEWDDLWRMIAEANQLLPSVDEAVVTLIRAGALEVGAGAEGEEVRPTAALYALRNVSPGEFGWFIPEPSPAPEVERS
jgi:hypothetical protein